MHNKLSSYTYDLVVVGSGIIGLAHAYMAARTGLRVAVVERDPRPVGASLRNFGFITQTGQKRGEFYQMAKRSTEVWREVADRFGLNILHRGLYMCVRRPEAEHVLGAFLQTEMGEQCELLRPSEAGFPLAGDIRSVLRSPHELRVESREVLPRLIMGLSEVLDVDFYFDTYVTEITESELQTQRGSLDASRIVVCPGDNVTGIYQDRLARYGIGRCKLQMLRLENPGIHLPGAVMSDLGLLRYLGYAELPESEDLRRVLEAEQAEHLDRGVHLIVVQGEDGSLVVGDSHDYENPDTPFALESVDQLILSEYRCVLGAPPAVRERWVGTYATAPDMQFLVDRPLPHVRLVVVTCGAGASTSFGLAEKTLQDLGVETDVLSH